MLSRLDEEAQEVILMSSDLARTHRVPQMRTVHVLDSLLRRLNGLPVKALEHFDVNVYSVRRAVEAEFVFGDHTGDLAMTPHAKRAVIDMAHHEAMNDHTAVGVQHLFLGILRTEECSAAKVLRGFEIGIKAYHSDNRYWLDAHGYKEREWGPDPLVDIGQVRDFFIQSCAL